MLCKRPGRFLRLFARHRWSRVTRCLGRRPGTRVRPRAPERWQTRTTSVQVIISARLTRINSDGPQHLTSCRFHVVLKLTVTLEESGRQNLTWSVGITSLQSRRSATYSPDPSSCPPPRFSAPLCLPGGPRRTQASSSKFSEPRPLRRVPVKTSALRVVNLHANPTRVVYLFVFFGTNLL